MEPVPSRTLLMLHRTRSARAALIVSVGAFVAGLTAGATASPARAAEPVISYGGAAGAGEFPTESTDRVVVELAPLAQSAAVADAVDGDVVAGAPKRTVVIEVPEGDAAAAAAALEARPDVVLASPERYYRTAVSPNDPCFLAGPACRSAGVQYDQWNLQRVGMANAWDVTRGDPNVRVAVIDTKVNGNHDDLAGKVIQGPSTVRGACPGGIPIGSFPRDHGSHVAGIIAANTNNGIGIAGAGWNVGIYAVEALDYYGCGATMWVADAIRVAADARHTYNVRVINLSIESDQNDPFVESAVQYAQERGVVVVAAAGNTGTDRPNYPAAYPGVIGVGSTDRNDNRAALSAYGASWVDIAAPGVDIVSTVMYGSMYGYEVLSGTSMAAPHVAATLALEASVFPTAGPEELIHRLLAQADPVPGTLTQWASGRLDAFNSVRNGDGSGFWAVASDGGIFSFGDAPFYGSTGAMTLNQPIVGMASTTSGNGYWLVASDGGIFSFGDAQFYGSTGAITLNRPIVGMASTASGNGYWLVASDGGIFAFGDATFYGSTGGIALNQPVVGMTATVSGQGYHLVARDGGIFSFGDAQFYGSTGGMQLNQPIFAMTTTTSGAGYWLVAADGGMFSFGNAQFYGSAGGLWIGSAVKGIAVTPSGAGYRMITEGGAVLNFGDAFNYGSLWNLNRPIVGMANR